MTKNEFEAKAGRPVPSAAERRLAATIRVRADKRRKAETPGWIKDLAKAS